MDLFRDWDDDQSGTIDVSEFGTAISALGCVLPFQTLSKPCPNPIQTLSSRSHPGVGWARLGWPGIRLGWLGIGLGRPGMGLG